MIRFFKENKPQVFVIIYIMLLLVFGYNLFENPAKNIYTDVNALPLYKIVFMGLTALKSIFWSYLFGLLVIGLMMFLIMRFDNRYIFLTNRSFLPSTVFLLISCSLPQNLIMQPALIGMLFLFIAHYKILGIYKNEEALSQAFDAAIAVSIGSLFYFPLIFYYVFILISILILGPVSWRVWVSSLFGLIIPYLITFALYFIIGIKLDYFLFNIKSNFLQSSVAELSLKDYIPVFYILFMVIVSGFYFVRKFATLNIANRNYFTVLIFSFIVSVLLFLFLPSVSLEIFVMAAIPSSVAFAHYFYYSRLSFWTNVVFVMFLIINTFNYFHVWEILLP